MSLTGRARPWSAEERPTVVRSLYDHAKQTPAYTDSEVDITFTQPATEREEVRTTARRIRRLLADGTAPADVGAVVTDRATYRRILAEVFSAYDIPVTFSNEPGIELA